MAEVFRAARTASLSAESGHAVGTVTHDGTRLGIDVEGRANGSNQTVFITTPDGGTAEVLTVGDGYWVGGDEAHWAEITGDPKAAKALVGKYAPVTESDATELGSFTLRTILTDAFAQPELAVLEVRQRRRHRDRGRRPAGLPARPRKAGHACGWPPTAAATLLRVVGPKSEPSDLIFTDWGRARRSPSRRSDKIVEG